MKIQAGKKLHVGRGSLQTLFEEACKLLAISKKTLAVAFI